MGNSSRQLARSLSSAPVRLQHVSKAVKPCIFNESGSLMSAILCFAQANNTALASLSDASILAARQAVGGNLSYFITGQALDSSRWGLPS